MLPNGGVQRRGVWHEAMVLVGLPVAAPIGLSPLHILTLCGSQCVLVVSTEPLELPPPPAMGGGGGFECFFFPGDGAMDMQGGTRNIIINLVQNRLCRHFLACGPA